MQPTSMDLASPLMMTSTAPSRSSGIPSVRAKLLAVPSGSRPNTVSVPRKKSTDEYHRRLFDRALHDSAHRLRILDRFCLDQLDARRRQLLARLLERIGAAAARGIDDQDRLF